MVRIRLAFGFVTLNSCSRRISSAVDIPPSLNEVKIVSSMPEKHSPEIFDLPASPICEIDGLLLHNR